MNKIEFTYQNQRIVGYCEKIGKKLWVYINGKTFTFEDTSQKSRKASMQNKAHSNEILAPMPGKIIRVNNQKQVKRGEVVIVMEAMKMEYSLKAEKDAHIKNIKVKEGDQVVLGQLLVEFGGAVD